MSVENCLWSILIAIMLPAIGVGLSAMAGEQRRVSHRPPLHPPGWRNRQLSKRANTARTRQGRA